jgi:hypothetical protein
MILVAPTIIPGLIGSGCPASFQAAVADGERTIPTPPLTRLVGAPCEKKSMLSISWSVSLSDQVSCVRKMVGVGSNCSMIRVAWSFLEELHSLLYPCTFWVVMTILKILWAARLLCLRRRCGFNFPPLLLLPGNNFVSVFGRMIHMLNLWYKVIR